MLKISDPNFKFRHHYVPVNSRPQSVEPDENPITSPMVHEHHIARGKTELVKALANANANEE